MNRILTLLAAVIILSSASDSTPQQKYIEQFAPMAIREMYRSGVPASITLAQGMLESRYGQSRLATEGNNHFGIKCHRDWKGKTIYEDDDARNECFRAYSSADQSFADHSDFLRYQDRYKFLFEYETSDYKSWATGLKKAGYATDPAYPQKLIDLIENYKLYEYDSMALSGDAPAVKSDKSQGTEQQANAKSKRNDRKKDKKQSDREEIPESPLSLEDAVPASTEGLEQFRFNLSRPVYTRNGVLFTYAMEGESYETISRKYNLFLREILKFNDASEDGVLRAGDKVYLQAKKKQTPKGLDKYIVAEDGESLRDICQRFAVRQQSIEKLNGFTSGVELREGDTIILRKVK